MTSPPTLPCSELWSAKAPVGAVDEVRALAAWAGSEPALTWGRLANEHPPVLRTHDRFGNRIDEVEYLPEYHWLMRVAVDEGLHGARGWRIAPAPTSRARRS